MQIVQHKAVEKENAGVLSSYGHSGCREYLNLRGTSDTALSHSGPMCIQLE